MTYHEIGESTMNANLMTKKIEMSKSEAKEAGKLNTEKFHELRQYMAIYPGFEVQINADTSLQQVQEAWKSFNCFIWFRTF